MSIENPNEELIVWEKDEHEGNTPWRAKAIDRFDLFVNATANGDFYPSVEISHTTLVDGPHTKDPERAKNMAEQLVEPFMVAYWHMSTIQHRLEKEEGNRFGLPLEKPP